MDAHPMILPHAAKDSPAVALLSPNARKVFDLLYDMVDGYASARPVWAIKRWVIKVGDSLHGSEQVQLVSPGWREVGRFEADPAPDFGIPRVDVPVPSVTFVKATGTKAVVPPTLHLGDFIRHMEIEGLGRPSTYAPHAQKLLDTGWIVGMQNVTLSASGRATLDRIRASDAAVFDAQFCRRFLWQLDEVAAGRRTPRECLREWLEEPDATMTIEWIERLHIEGDSAQTAYEARENIDRVTVYWPAGMLPPDLDPEVSLPSDSLYRDQRTAINNAAAALVGEKWLDMSHEERAGARIRVVAGREAVSVEEWMETHRYDVLKRWLVGWTKVS